MGTRLGGRRDRRGRNSCFVASGTHSRCGINQEHICPRVPSSHCNHVDQVPVGASTSRHGNRERQKARLGMAQRRRMCRGGADLGATVDGIARRILALLVKRCQNRAQGQTAF